MHKFATKFAASTLVIAIAIVGCQSDTMVSRAVASTSERAEQQASRLADQARAVLQRGNAERALSLAERAVEMSPRDSGYRMLLADLYLRNGRFASAENTYSDVLQLDPGNVRAGLSVALALIAQGRSSDALIQLESLDGSAPPSDVGLAYALAGQPQRGIEVLEPAARAPDATGRTRQNLALAYALAGDWTRARTVAAQDVSPAELGRRLEQWASLAQPSGSHSAVATLLGVTPRVDPGQPVRLALAAPEPQAQAYAEAAPAPEPVAEAPMSFAEAAPAAVAEVPVEAPVQAPIQYAEAPVVEPVVAPVVAPASSQPVRTAAWWPAPSSAPAVPVVAAAAAPAAEAAVEPEQPEVRYAAAVRTLSTPSPAAVRAPAVAPARTMRPTFRPAPVVRASSIAARIPRAGAGAGRFVVQLGAFADPNNAERAWAQATSRFGLANAEAHTARIQIGGRTLTRVSVAGFTSRADASRLCASIQSRGGSCFVRGVAGDAPVRWASNASRSRRG